MLLLMETSYSSATLSSSATSSFQSKPTLAQIRAAAQALGHILKDDTYAVVGGAACAVLGSGRETTDVDFVVPQGATATMRKVLKDQPKYFDVDGRTLHTYYKSTPPVEIEIVAPPALFKERFDASTPTIVVEGVKILKPALILNAKCRSVLGRATAEKKYNDAQDIQYLLYWCAKMETRPTAEEVPNATRDFVLWFISEYKGEEYWKNAGYDLDKGQFALLKTYASATDMLGIRNFLEYLPRR